MVSASIGSAQNYMDGSIMHDGLQRDYKIYVPAIYQPGTPVPVVFNFHGYTSDNFQQSLYADFRSIADTANFIIVLPNGTLDPCLLYTSQSPRDRTRSRMPSYA